MDGLASGGTRHSGKHVKSEEARRIEMEERGLGPEAVKIMKDQDLAYVRMQRLMDGKKIEKLQSSLHYLEGNTNNDEDEEGVDSTSLNKMVKKRRKHTVFVEGTQKEADEGFDVAKHFDTIPELMGRAFNRPRVKTLEKQAMLKKGMGNKVPLTDADDDYYNDDDDDQYDQEGNPIKPKRQPSEKQLHNRKRNQRKLEKRVAKSRSAAYSEMEMRNERLKKLQNAEAHLIVEKQVQMKGRKRKIVGGEGDDGGGKPAVYKWRRKRAK